MKKELFDMRGKVTQVLPTVGTFSAPDFRKANGDYWAIGIQDVDTKVVSWVLEDEESDFNMEPIITAKWEDFYSRLFQI